MARLLQPRALAGAWIVGSLAILGQGCGSRPTVTAAPSRAQLLAVAMAYMQATDELNRPPNNKEELLPYLKDIVKAEEAAAPAELLRSRVDGEEFVIHWGVDFRDLDVPPAEYPVLAYEKIGKDGKRLVVQYRHVKEMTLEKLQSLPFPKGHRPP